MSLILTWDHPAELTALPHTARVSRTLGAGTVVIATDITWGTFEDIENNDPTLAYYVEYLDRAGNPFAIVADGDIKRFTRPTPSVLITFASTLSDGSPASGRWIELSDESTGASLLRRIYLNAKGRGAVLGLVGRRVLIREEGKFTALDVVIPAGFATIDITTLRQLGSLVDADKRGWY